LGWPDVPTSVCTSLALMGPDALMVIFNGPR